MIGKPASSYGKSAEIYLVPGWPILNSTTFWFKLVLRELRVARIYLADTLGVLAPDDVTRYVGLMSSTWPAAEKNNASSFL